MTDNGKGFADRLSGSREKSASGARECDEICHAFGIKHRLTQPRSRPTNGVIERFNGWIAVMLTPHGFDSAQDRETTLMRYAWLYNHRLPQQASGRAMPIDAMQRQYAEKPELFI
ncbi:MAG: integrase core domain-containing protein [Kistimonas sp.]|nr:integrase core domain-containing protein [Kistimonas sp.]